MDYDIVDEMPVLTNSIKHLNGLLENLGDHLRNQIVIGIWKEKQKSRVLRAGIY